MRSVEKVMEGGGRGQNFLDCLSGSFSGEREKGKKNNA